MFGHKFASLSTLSCTQNLRQTIHQAVASKNIQAVVDLIKSGVDLNLQDEKGRTPLHALAYPISDEDADSINIIKLLLESGADPNIKDRKGRTPLLIAARRKKPAMVDFFLTAENIEVNSFDDQRWTPLFHAVQYENYFDDEEEYLKGDRQTEDTPNEKAEHIVKLLLVKGANPNYCDEEKNTPLHTVFLPENLNSTIAKQLLDTLANPNARNKKGDTPLHVLAYSFLRGDSHMAELLLEKDADPNSQNEKGETPFHIAVLMGTELVDLLITSGKMNVNLPDRLGRTPLFYAVNDDGDDGPDITEALLARGANLNHQCEYGYTVLHLAAHKGSIVITQMLIQYGAEVNVRNKAGETPLYIAIHKGCIVITQMLIQHGAEVNVRNKAGETPLYIAIIVGDIKVVGSLIESRADVNTECNEGYTPFYLAATGWLSYAPRKETEHRPLFDMVKLLLDKRGDCIDWKDEAYRKKLWDDITDERIKELLVPVFQKAAMWDLWWIMEKAEYESYFQWLPREIVEDVQSSFFSREYIVKRKRIAEENERENIKRFCQDLLGFS